MDMVIPIKPWMIYNFDLLLLISLIVQYCLHLVSLTTGMEATRVMTRAEGVEQRRSKMSRWSLTLKTTFRGKVLREGLFTNHVTIM